MQSQSVGTPLMPGSPLCPSQCQALVLQYEPAAVRLFVQMMDPTFVCTVSVPIPGASFGPACRPGWSEAPHGGLLPLPPTLILYNAENQSL